MSRESFRPLAGISCVVRVLGRRRALPGFRPLAGISCVGLTVIGGNNGQGKFPSPRGDKLCQTVIDSVFEDLEFPSPRGDKLCRKRNSGNCSPEKVSVPSRG